MTAIAAGRAGALGLRNVTTRVLDIESIDEPDGSYDVVLCREGLMFAPDPAARQPARSTASCAQAAGSPSPCGPSASAIRGSGSCSTRSAPQTGAPVPPPGVPGPFSLGDAGLLAGLLADAGLADVHVSEAAGAAARRLVRRVVGADVGARRPAHQDPLGDARRAPGRPCARDSPRACGRTRRRPARSRSPAPRSWPRGAGERGGRARSAQPRRCDHTRSARTRRARRQRGAYTGRPRCPGSRGRSADPGGCRRLRCARRGPHRGRGGNRTARPDRQRGLGRPAPR